jgi:hypothetical protein
MNVTFHAIGSFATAAVLSLKGTENRRSRSALMKYLIGFVTGILVHGVLDLSPHQYPIPSKVDVILAPVLLLLFLFCSQKQDYPLILACFAGCVFPDIIDLGPVIVDKYLGISLPRLPFRLFPWHTKEYSGSIYDGSRNNESNIYHILVLVIGFGLIYAYRKNLFKFGKDKI